MPSLPPGDPDSRPRSAELYLRLVEQLHDGAVFLTDTLGRITTWNPGVKRLLDYCESEWVGQSAALIFPPEDLADGAFENEMDMAVQNGQAADIRWHLKKNGNRIFIDGVLVALKNEAGLLLGFGKLMRDATHAKLAEESLRHSEEQLRLAQEGAQLGIWDWDILKDRVTRSETHYRLFGQQPQKKAEEFSEWLLSVHSEDQSKVEEDTKQALITGHMQSEFRVTWPDGSAHWLEGVGKVHFELDRPVRMIRLVRDITAKKQTELALAHSEARKTAIVNASLDAVLLMDSSGRVQEFNPAAERMFGHPRAEALGQSLAELIVPPPLRAAHKAGLARYLETGYSQVLGQRIEIQGMRSDGSEFPVDLAISRVDVEGPPLFVGYIRDISERKRIHDELRAARDEAHTILESITDGFYALDQEWRFIYLNAAAEQIIGARRADLLGKSHWEIFAPAVGTMVEAEYRRAVRDRVPLEFENQYQERWFLIKASPTQEGGLSVYFRDITKRKLAESALAERARLAALGAEVGAALTQLASLPEALQRCAEAIVTHLDAAFARIWTLAPQGDVLELQASAGLYTHLDGLHSKVRVGNFKIGLIAQERRPHLTNDVLNDPRVSDPNWAAREGIVSFAGYPLVVDDRLVGVLGLFARRPLPPDTLTVLASASVSVAIGIERKRSEDILASQAEELARSNADLQQFAYVTSHDLQDPLRTMINFSQLLTKRYGGQLGPDADECLNYIVSGARRMQDLVNSLLAYSRVVNVETMPFSPVSLSSVLHWASMNLQTVIEETRTIITHDELPTVQADQVQLVQLVQNLIGNAIKYRKPEEQPIIHLSARRGDRDWVIAIRDNGIGIRPEYAERIFGVFKRLHGREIPGTGIGLAIAKRVVERHGGRIWVESNADQGSTFCFTIPA